LSIFNFQDGGRFHSNKRSKVSTFQCQYILRWLWEKLSRKNVLTNCSNVLTNCFVFFYANCKTLLVEAELNHCDIRKYLQYLRAGYVKEIIAIPLLSMVSYHQPMGWKRSWRCCYSCGIRSLIYSYTWFRGIWTWSYKHWKQENNFDVML